MFFKPTPPGLSLYSSVDWAAVVSLNEPQMTVTGAHYDPVLDRVVLDFSYSSSITQAQVQVNLNTGNDSRLVGVPSFSRLASTKATNNAALIYYDSYGMADVVKYLSIFIGVAALLMFAAGFFGGRLIGLECMAVIQLSYMMLLTVEDLSASLSGLSYLRYSFGYNSITAYDM
jgi:hypothetical protein